MITTPVVKTNIPPHSPEAVVSIGKEYITMAENLFFIQTKYKEWVL